MNKVLFCLLSLFGFNALATGSFSCETDASVNNAQITIYGVTSRSFENAIVSAEGQANGSVGDDGVSFTFDYALTKADIMQYWNSGDEFRLVIYSEKEVNGQLEFLKTVIKTSTTDGITFTGDAIVSGPSWSMEVPVSCEIE